MDVLLAKSTIAELQLNRGYHDMIIAGMTKHATFSKKKTRSPVQSNPSNSTPTIQAACCSDIDQHAYVHCLAVSKSTRDSRHP